jgi:hypothetical protein
VKDAQDDHSLFAIIEGVPYVEELVGCGTCTASRQIEMERTYTGENFIARPRSWAIGL